mmetsp:Transcript_6250/g.10347  ORF Transcript_6250/g.10347 Transcript_6250/m.10347 type:complete len:275 (+) Transcript_6250:78-902(+)
MNKGSSWRIVSLCLALALASELLPTVAAFCQIPKHSVSQNDILFSRTLSLPKATIAPHEHEMEEPLELPPKTMPAAVARFFLGPDVGPISIVGILIGFSGWRMEMGSAVGVNDAFLFAASIVFWWFQEHIMHQRLLHSDFDWMGKEIHQGHHNKPYFHVSIDPAGLMIGWLTAVHVILRLVLPVDLAVSATIGYAGAGLMYEWAHYVAHTRVKPPNQFWKRVRDNHIKHHMVDNRYWFGFSLPAIDDWFGTNPSLLDVKQAKAAPAPAKELQNI